MRNNAKCVNPFFQAFFSKPYLLNGSASTSFKLKWPDNCKAINCNRQDLSLACLLLFIVKRGSIATLKLSKQEIAEIPTRDSRK